jgi:hypothetical protein
VSAIGTGAARVAGVIVVIFMNRFILASEGDSLELAVGES